VNAAGCGPAKWGAWGALNCRFCGGPWRINIHTGDMPALKGKKEQLHCIAFEGELYIRQSGRRMLIGTYEKPGALVLD